MTALPTIHMVGTTHFDPVWMWTWDEAMASIRSTFRSALDRMQEDPRFVYSFSCPPVFEWVRKVDPALFEEIRARVREGRWELVEGWWVQPDCNAISGESCVRQGLHGQRYLLEHFGQMGSAGFNTDSFGHNRMLPQILRKSGMTAYVFGRPSEAQQQLPGPLFVWESPDGSRILAYRCGGEGANSYSKDVKSEIEALGERVGSMRHDLLLLYGVSNHGGAPTRQAIADINGFLDNDSRGFSVCFGSVRQFFEQQNPGALPVVADELQVRDFGPFVNHSEVKTLNRRAEYALLNAERFVVLSGMEVPARILQQSWQDVLFNQFHDIIGGASVKPAYVDARNLHGRALQNAREILHTALQILTRDMDTAFEGFPLVVFNPNPFDVDSGIEAELQWAWEFPWYAGDLTLTDPMGKNVPCQVIQELSALPRFRSRFVFQDQIPSLGYKVYQVTQATPPTSPPQELNASASVLENERFRIDLDPESGFIATIYDKHFRRTVLRDTAVPRMLEDRGDNWAFNIEAFGAEAGRFRRESVTVIENGPVRAVVRIKSRCLDSTFEQDLLLYQGSGAIEGRFRVHWREQRRALKLVFETTLAQPVVTSAIPYGSVERGGDGREMPAGEWLDLSGNDWGISLLTDSIFSYDVAGSTAGLTLLRSPIYAHHGHPLQKRKIDEALDYDHMEQGVREGSWKLVVHDAGWRDARIPALATAFNNPVITVDEASHPGTRPRQDALFRVKSRSVLATALKPPEEGEGLILRLHEYAGCEDEAEIALPQWNRTVRVCLGAYEIKTLRLHQEGAVPLMETDLLERELVGL